MSHDLSHGLQVQREGEAAVAAEALDLGIHVRALRKARGWTLEQAAVQAGLARSTLSKIENGQMSPTFEALKKLAQGMGLTIPQLFTPVARPGGLGRLQVTKLGQGQPLITPTYEHELLAQGLKDKRMLPYRARIRSHDIDEFDGWIRHEGEEFLFVLTGVVRLYSEFYEPVDLRRGDSAYYDAAMGHNLISVSDDDATVLWVTSQG